MAISRIQQEGLFLQWDPPLDELTKRLKTFGPSISAKYLGSALRKAAVPAESALKANVNQLGKVTGNLRRAVTTKVKRYTNTGNAIALIGFKAVPGRRVPEGGDDESAFHAGLIEFGTKNRTTKKGSIASSFYANQARRSNFKIVRPKYKKGMMRRIGTRAVTKPKYPIAFFARAPNNAVVNLGRTRAYAPIKRAWQQSRSQCQTLLTDALYDAIINASKDIFAP